MTLKDFCLGVVIVSIVLFTVVSLLAIWDIISDGEFVWKSLLSLAVVGFSGLVGIVISDRMNKPLL